MNCELSCDTKNMDKECSTSTGQSSEVSDNFQEIPGRCLLKEIKSDYMCNLCNKSFAKEKYLNNHIKLHVAKKSHCCQICSKSFTLKGVLKRHLLTHSGEKLHSCNICNKSFTIKGSLKRHLLTHSGEKSHVCNICMKSFALNDTFKRHSLTHNGVKPHVCNICNISFAQKRSLKDHLLTHRGEKPHLCNMCSMSFRHKDCLKKHSLIHRRKRDMKNSSSDKGEELAPISEKSKNVNSDSHLAEKWENSQENNHPERLQVKEEIDYIVKEEHDIGEEYSYSKVGEMLIKSDDIHKMACDVKKENIHDEMNDMVEEEHDIDYEEVGY